MTVEEYFQLEENDPDTRYEYIDGYVYALAGGTANHDTVKSNIQRILWNLLRGSKCRVYSSDMKVYISETRYFHPGVIVTCDPRDRGTIQAIQSPRLVVEVLSPTSELTDRTWKLKNYRAHPTIEEYVLADSQSFKIEIYHKENSKWIYEAFDFNLRDPSGETQNVAYDPNAPATDLSGKVEPGSPIKGGVTFAVLSTTHHFQLFFEVSVIASGQTIWDIDV